MPYVYIDPAWSLPSWWPETGPIENEDIGFEPNLDAAWRLDLCRDGTLSLRMKGEKSFNGAAIPIYWHDDREALEGVQHLMCRLGYPEARDKRLTHEGGERWYFSWVPMTGTLWQLNAVQRIIHMHLSPDFTNEQVSKECERLTALVQKAADEIAAGWIS